MSIEKPGQDEFEFPDEAEQVVEKEVVDELDIEIEDDTPAADRGRQPLPKELVDELEKDELEEYSDKVKNRLKQMKKVWHDERREKERAMREQNEAMAFAKRMLEENKKLKTTLFEGEKTYLDTYKASAELELGVAKKQYKDAYEAGDSDGIVEAQSKLAEVNYKIQKAREYTPRGRNNEKQIQEKLHALIGICRYDGHDLLDEVISSVPQQYNDVDKNGNDLTHRVIRGWFQPYVFDNFKL